MLATNRAGRIALALLLALSAQWLSWTTDAQTIRVMTYNVKSFEGAVETTLGHKYVMKPFFDAFDKVSPDICVINELEVYTDALGDRNPLAELAGHLGMHYYFCKSYDRSELNRGAGLYGNGILSRYPIIRMDCRRLSMPTGSSDPRSVFWADLLLPNGNVIRVVCTHLDHMGGQVEQLSEILKRSEVFETNRPIIMMGDFNTDPGTVSYALGLFGNKLAISANNWVDYILTTPDIKCGSPKVDPFSINHEGASYDISDHASVYMDLTL